MDGPVFVITLLAAFTFGFYLGGMSVLKDTEDVLLHSHGPTLRAPAERGGRWACNVCGNSNKDESANCGFCDAPRPGR